MKTKITLLAFLVFGASLANAQEIIEAENFVENVYASVTDNENFSGGKFVAMNAALGANVKYVVEATAAGTYDLTIYYATMAVRRMYIKVENYLPVIVEFDNYTGSWNGTAATNEGGELVEGIKTKTVQVYLVEGENTIEIGAYDSPTESWSPNFDKFAFEPSTTALPVPPTITAPVVIEAENATRTLGVEINAAACYSNGQGVFNVGSSSEVIFENINAVTEGVYDVTVYYTTLESRSFQVKSNFYQKTLLNCNTSLPYWTCPDPNKPEEIVDPNILKKTAQVYFKQGNNTLYLTGYKGGHSPNFDKIEIRKSGYTMPEPDYDVLSSIFDFTDNLVNYNTDITEENTTSRDNLLKLIDNNEYTTYVVSGVSSQQITVKTAYPIILTGYALATAFGVSTDVLDDWTMEYSVNGIDWNAVSGIGTNNAGNFRKVLTGNKYDSENGTTSAQYFRLTAKGNGSVEIGEWQLFGCPYISDTQHFPNDDLTKDVDYENILDYCNANPDGFSRDEWGEVYEKVFDKLLNTVYTVVDNKNFWIEFYPADPVALKSYALTGRFGWLNRNPSKWKLEAMNNFDEWTVLDTREGISFPTDGATMMFNIAEPIETYAYRLTVEDTQGDGTSNLVQWQMFANHFGVDADNSAAKNILQNADFTAIGGKGFVEIRSCQENAAYSIYNLLGECVTSGKITENLHVALPQNIYIVKVNNAAVKVVVN